MAITSPLLDNISVEGATGVLINIVGGPDMRMREIEEAATLVQEQAHEDANIIFGATIDENMGEMIKVTVIATGFEHLVNEVPASLAAGSSRPSVQVQHSITSSHAAAAAAAAAPLAARVPSPTQRPALRTESRDDLSTAFSTRRSAAAPTPAPVSAPRERTSFVPPLDADWDTPAYQRRGQ
jgi:cell division protein FtsZ